MPLLKLRADYKSIAVYIVSQTHIFSTNVFKILHCFFLLTMMSALWSLAQLFIILVHSMIVTETTSN